MLAFMPVREGPAKRKQTNNYKPKGSLQCTAHISQHHHKKTTHQPPPQEAKARIVTSCHLLYRLRAFSRAPPGNRAAFSSRILRRKPSQSQLLHHVDPLHASDDFPSGRRINLCAPATLHASRSRRPPHHAFDSTLGYPGEGPAHQTILLGWNINGAHKVFRCLRRAKAKKIDIVVLQETHRDRVRVANWW